MEVQNALGERILGSLFPLVEVKWAYSFGDVALGESLRLIILGGMVQLIM